MLKHSTAAEKDKLLHALKKYFGYDVFRPHQEEIVTHVIRGKDGLVLMPTGGGKSICFQLPALLRPGMTLVISPLISLMKDQVDTLQANGIPAAYVNSTLSTDELEKLKEKIARGEIKLLYLAPERLAIRHFREWLEKQAIGLLAIDEAHCISEWGHDFRPEYRNLIHLRRDFPEVPLLALTATATPQVQSDIVRQLDLRSPKIFVSSFNRPNLYYTVRPKKNAFKVLTEELQENASGSTIIYCFSRKGTEELASRLTQNGYSALPYHAGLSAAIRHTTQEKFIRDEVKIIVATIAFGMGIDKPDVRLIVHYDLPKSIEGYYQETGRAGRDGLASRCVLLYSYGDTTKHCFFIRKIEDRDERDRAEEQLQKVIEYAEKNTCRRRYLLAYFGEDSKDIHCTGCDICFPVANARTSNKAELLEYDRGLFDRLRQLRKKIADARGVPPFVIFGDRSLQDMARYYPQSLESFTLMHGVGQGKLRDFGKIFIASIQEFCRKNNIEEKKKTSYSAATRKRAVLGPTHQTTLILLQQRLSLQRIAQSRGLTVSTILSHIEALQRTNVGLDITYLRPDSDRFMRIAEAFKRSSAWSLSPAKKLLGDGYTYDELRLVRIFLLNAQSKHSN